MRKSKHLHGGDHSPSYEGHHRLLVCCNLPRGQNQLEFLRVQCRGGARSTKLTPNLRRARAQDYQVRPWVRAGVGGLGRVIRYESSMNRMRVLRPALPWSDLMVSNTRRQSAPGWLGGKGPKTKLTPMLKPEEGCARPPSPLSCSRRSVTPKQYIGDCHGRRCIVAAQPAESLSTRAQKAGRYRHGAKMA